MDIQTEKSSLIDLLQKINDISLLEKVKAFVLTEIQPVNLTPDQTNELDKRFADHYQNKDSNVDAFEFLDNLKSK